MTLTVTPKLVVAAFALLAVGVFAGVQIGKFDRPPVTKKYPAPNPTVTQRLAEPEIEEEAQSFEDTGIEDHEHDYDEDSGFQNTPEDDGSYYDDGGVDYTQPAPCPDCGNSGYRTCFSCDGTGMIDNSGARAIAGLGQSGPPDETCSTCGGSGRQRCLLH
jgi:hypothetical protein